MVDPHPPRLQRDKRVTGKAGKRRTPNAQRPTPNVEVTHYGVIAGRCALEIYF